MYTEEVNKIVLSSNYGKRLQTFDRITTNPHGTNAVKICESEMLMVMKYKGFAPIERNWIFTTIVAKCILNRSIRFRKEEMFSVIKYKDFLLDNINHVKELNKIFNAITSVVDYYILSDISISDIRPQIRNSRPRI